MPHDLRVAEIFLAWYPQYRVASHVFDPCRPVVDRVSEILVLFDDITSRLVVHMARVDQDVRSLASWSCLETAGVVDVDDGTPTEDHLARLLHQSHLSVLNPMDEVRRHCMPPAHVTPKITERVVLKEQMVTAIKTLEETIWIVDPILAW